MAPRNKAQVDAHLKQNQFVQMVQKCLDAGESDEKISKRLMDAKNRIMQYGSVNEAKGTISSRFIPAKATDEELRDLREIEVAQKYHSVDGRSESWRYKELGNAVAGVLADGSTPTVSKQLANLSAKAKKDAPKQKAPWNSVTFRM